MLIGERSVSTFSLKLYKQSLVTLCLGYAVGVWALAFQKNERTFLSVRFSDLVKQQRIGTKLPSWILCLKLSSWEIEHWISFHKLFFQLDVLEVFSTRDHTGCPPPSAIADITGSCKICPCWWHLTKNALLASWNRSRIQLGPIMRLFRKFFPPPPDKADMVGIFPLSFCRMVAEISSRPSKCWDSQELKSQTEKRTNPLFPI